MSSPPSDGSSPTGAPDRRILRLLERRLASDPLVVATEFDPEYAEPRTLEARVDTDPFPPSTDAVRLDIRWFETDDFSFHYVETGFDDGRWECRWDRHPNPHDDRLHFHRPPTGTEVGDLELSSLHPLDVFSTVLAAVENRIEQAWD